eukprot:1314881-Amorphochlora_amoeboformis.AAC.1
MSYLHAVCSSDSMYIFTQLNTGTRHTTFHAEAIPSLHFHNCDTFCACCDNFGRRWALHKALCLPVLIFMTTLTVKSGRPLDAPNVVLLETDNC